MRIFVGEYVSGGGLVSTPLDDIAPSLRREGAAMLRALTEDLSEVAEVVVAVDWRLTESFDGGRLDIRPISQTVGIWHQWISAAARCEKAILVAPEIDGTLAKGVAMLRAAGIDVVACSGEFLRAASDKWLTAKTLLGAGVAHPASIIAGDRRFAAQMPATSRYVVKPRDGCGTHSIRMCDELPAACGDLASNEICQVYVDGRAVSIATIATDSQVLFLPAVDQILDSSTCEYEGGSGPLDEDSQRRASHLVSRAITAMPPKMRGFVGFDLLLGEEPGQDVLIEINPRLTTSYVGLRKMVDSNLAAHMIGLAGDPIACSVQPHGVRWTADGAVSWADGLHPSAT